MRRSIIIALLAIFSPTLTHAYVAITNKADHDAIHIVPAPGKIAIDGDLSDWDLSGAIVMFMDDASKSAYSVRGAMMYDADYLYIGGQVKDPTPMVNNYGFGGDYNMAWNADAIQLRFVSNPAIKSSASIQSGGNMPPADQQFVNHITLWYSTLDQKAGYVAMYTLGFVDKVLNPPGVEGAFKKDADGKGYAFEYRIPYKILRAPRAFQGGDQLQTQWQLHWGNDTGTAVRCGMTDVRNREGSGDLGYMGPGSWGRGIVEAKGHLKAEEKEGAVGRAPGHIPVKFKMEHDGKASLAICDAKGAIVRTCFGAEPFKAGEQTYLWDGLDDADRPVAPGNYNAKILTHAGVTQKYICDIGVSGTPPYQTDDGRGGWASDYNAPLYIAADGDRVIMGTGNSEAACGSACVNLEGVKQYGMAAMGGALTLHNGYGYFVQRGSGKLLRFELEHGYLTPFSSGNPEAAIITRRADEKDNNAWYSRSWQMHAITSVGDTLIVSSWGENKLHLVDPASGVVKGEAPVERPFGVAADPKGVLYVVSNNSLGRYDLASRQFTAIAKDLDTPQHLACDKDGNIYASLGGKTMQVWKFDKDGKVLLKYGKVGGRPALGKFDAGGMLNPYAIAVDKNGRLWVAEADAQPKRYSVWNADGSLWKDFYGSMDYSTSAYIDIDTPQYVYAQCVRYEVDYDKGTWKVDATMFRPATDGPITTATPGSHGGAVFVKRGGRTFLVTNNAQDPSASFTVYEKVSDRFIPRMAYGTGKKADGGAFRGLWTDANNDGKVQENELAEGHASPGAYWTSELDKNLDLHYFDGIKWASQGGVKTTKPYSVTRWECLGFNEHGGLKFADFTKKTPIATDTEGGALAATTLDNDMNIYTLVSGGTLERGARAQGSGHRVVKFSPSGEKLWEYQNVHCAFAWTSDAYTPGYLVGALRFGLGEHKDLLPVTGYYGQYFLLDKTDGLFVDALGDDQRSAYVLGPQMVLTENFNGTIFQHPKNGKTYFIGGDADLRLWELLGLDTIKRKTMSLTVTAAMVAQAEKNARQAFEAKATVLAKKTLVIKRLKNAAADGKYDEWAGVPAQSVLMEGNRSAQVQLGYDDGNLYARFQVSDDSPLLNTPTDYKLLFKSGDAVELCLGNDLKKRAVHGQNQQEPALGDTRVLVARTPEGKMVATRYRPLTAEKDKPNKASFTTQSSGTDTFDEVVAWNDLPMNCTASKDGYIVEVALPWAVLGIAPKSGLELLGDAGVIYGNQGGTKNAIRYLWSDKSPEVSVNNDIPTESRLHPNHWARLTLE